ncbi:uncharacterized protein BO97DRAFT_176126 [Aspergillus homomorphus CBS 101889]|uniref:Uncharacterized protein n=1 Tax=Aspergillus homomorphus (strain CBS 101889) TaxID=1450537 RepID=A0A395I9V0_ASPHC|nr:hypothetical protein BO97DRAFT_176126 [Aspergillus homomorphus CBS 101889]RAL15848.1 hypothetical protein BO97DRAFT_176126 [Aspergillus homomorphus CBS 101889]
MQRGKERVSWLTAQLGHFFLCFRSRGPAAAGIGLVSGSDIASVHWTCPATHRVLTMFLRVLASLAMPHRLGSEFQRCNQPASLVSPPMTFLLSLIRTVKARRLSTFPNSGGIHRLPHLLNAYQLSRT